MTYLAELLIRIKLDRKRCQRTHKLGGPAYDSFTEAICELYEWLDRLPIEEIEKACWTSRKRT